MVKKYCAYYFTFAHYANKLYDAMQEVSNVNQNCSNVKINMLTYKFTCDNFYIYKINVTNVKVMEELI